MNETNTPDQSIKMLTKSQKGVKIGITFAKWGNQDEHFLNEVISVNIFKVGGKNWNLLLKKLRLNEISGYFKLWVGCDHPTSRNVKHAS